MLVGILKLELFFPAPNSLKAKRFVLKRIAERVRRRFNVSVSEIDYHDKWQRSVLGVSIVGIDKRFMNSVLDKVIDTVEEVHEAEILDQGMQFI